MTPEEKAAAFLHQMKLASDSPLSGDERYMLLQGFLAGYNERQEDNFTKPKLLAMNQIKQIIEKYASDSSLHGTIIHINNFPTLEKELVDAMKAEAVAFAAYMWKDFYDSAKGIYRGLSPSINDTGLYDYFKFKQWADGNGYTKTPGGWITPGGVPVEETILMEKFKQSV